MYDGARMDTKRNRGQSKELHFALDVLEERAHLGLDDEHAGTIRSILLRRIAEAEEDLSCCPARPVHFSFSTKISA